MMGQMTEMSQRNKKRSANARSAKHRCSPRRRRTRRVGGEWEVGYLTSERIIVTIKRIWAVFVNFQGSGKKSSQSPD